MSGRLLACAFWTAQGLKRFSRLGDRGWTKSSRGQGSGAIMMTNKKG
jgi:hypothetical protein